MLKRVHNWFRTCMDVCKDTWELASAKLAYEQGECESVLPVFEKHAEQGDINAQDICGDCYYRGKAKNINKALYWSEKAAEQGNLDSQLRCVAIYSHGRHKSLITAETRLYSALISHKGVDPSRIMNAHLGLFIGWAEEWIESLEQEDNDVAELKAAIEELVDGWSSIFSDDSLAPK